MTERNRQQFVLEGCVDSLESAWNAAEGGATRLELCANLVIGGTTPSRYLFEQVRSRLDLPIRALIRPRFGDFCYSESEFSQMLQEVAEFARLGADGVVFGVLSPDGSLDLPRMEQLRREAGSMKATLHRAFDLTADPVQTLEEAISLGIDAILTSGQRESAVLGIETLAKLVSQAGDRVEIMAGASVSGESIPLLHYGAGIFSFHLSGRRAAGSPMLYRREGVPMGLPFLSEYDRWVADPDAFRAARAALDALAAK